MAICLDDFTICIIVFLECDLDIDAKDKKKTFAVKKGASYPFTIAFTYVLGTDFDPAGMGFGFDTVYPNHADPKMILQSGVSITDETFAPVAPDVTQLPTTIITAVYSAKINFPDDEAMINAIIAKGNATFGGEVQYNDGGK